ncbi:indolethylamine N-methyltransferase-like [Orbicella faveolata]|uniref:indolethylamine N-methyltransferase-like n=1 Tax=Orbicella faveolata TaxID=48498 RepID=UPI0009E21B9C|nr:indolethylamine N-methyltransferase-like [Orbicella faveolata]
MMDSFHFGEDYHDKFDPKAYLKNYSQVESYSGEFSLRCFHEFWSKMAKRNVRVLDFGGGPAIYDLISAVPYAEEIIFAEYSEENRKEVAAWRERSRDAHDWSPYFSFVVQRFEGKGSEKALIREAELRKKITHILPCDIALEDPVRWPSTWTSQLGLFDVVTTSFCIEAAVKSEVEYGNAIAKLKKYLKPGGYLVMHSSIGETFYTVGKEKFRCYFVSENQIREILRKEGFCEVADMKLQAEPTSELYDREKLYFVSAKVKSVQ